MCGRGVPPQPWVCGGEGGRFLIFSCGQTFLQSIIRAKARFERLLSLSLSDCLFLPPPPPKKKDKKKKKKKMRGGEVGRGGTLLGTFSGGGFALKRQNQLDVGLLLRERTAM